MRTFALCVMITLAGCDGAIVSAPLPVGAAGGSAVGAGAGGGQGGAPSGGGTPIDDSLVPKLCQTPTEPAKTKQLRMNRTQYVNALSTLFTPAAIAQARLTTLPPTRVRHYSSEIEEVSSAEVEAYHAIAFELAFYVADRPSELAALEPCLGTAPITPACVTTFLTNFGRRVFRRPMSAADLTYLRSAYALGAAATPAEGIGTMILTALTDYEFLYRVEFNGTGNSLLTLTDHELATRVAFALWNAPADAALSAAADRGLTSMELDAQLDRMLADPKAKVAIGRFYDEWLGTTQLPPLGGFVTTTDPVRLQASMVKELRDFTTHITFDRDGSYRDLLTDRSMFTDDAELAALYGVVRPAAGQAAQLPAGERAGVLTRAGWLMTAPVKRSNAGHVIKRGVRIGELLCRPLPPPDPSLFPSNDPADPATNPNLAVRERFETLTRQPQCAGCHDRIDNWGGSFGHYSSAGQYISTESVFDAQGMTTASLRVNSVSSPDFDATFEPAAMNALDFSQRLGASQSGAQCMAKQLATNFSGRPFTDQEGCWVEQASRALQGGSIKSAIKALMTAPEYRLKKL
jgi:hypothetical protein